MGVRAAGSFKIVGGLVFAVVSYVLVLTVLHMVGRRTSAILIILGPLIALVGLFEVLSGVGYRDWMAHWPVLPSWLKAVITLASIVVLLTIIIGMVVMVR